MQLGWLSTPARAGKLLKFRLDPSPRLGYNYIYNSENTMYNATIYNTYDDSSAIVYKQDSYRFLLEAKVIWYCFRKFPLRHTLYVGAETSDITVLVRGVKVARIVFDETPPAPELNAFGMLV